MRGRAAPAFRSRPATPPHSACMTGSAWRPSCTATTICGSHSPPLLAPLQLRDEEDLAARPDRLVIADLVALAVDRDRGLLDQMLAEPRQELVHRLDHAAHARGL